MRVLFVIHFPVFGGPHNQALRLSHSLGSLGWDTLVLLPSDAGDAVARLKAGGVQVVALPLHRLRSSLNPLVHVGFISGFLPEIAAIRRVIRREGIDVVQVGGLVNPHAAIAARLEGVPVVWQLLDTRAPRLLASVCMTFVRALADVVMSTGETIARSHPGGQAIASRTISFFPPVDTHEFRPRRDLRDRVRAEWGVAADVTVIGCVANINPQKGIVDLLHAFAAIRMDKQGARLVLVGAEYATQVAYSAVVRGEAERLGLDVGEDVVMVGPRDDVHRQLAGMDIFAFTPAKHGEGISTVVLEAMACGLPVVSYRVGGLAEAINDGIDGVLIDPGDHAGVAKAIVKLLDDTEGTTRMAAAARRRATEEFDVTRSAATHVAAYRSAVGASPQPTPAVIALPVTVCPGCRGALSRDIAGLGCAGCGRAYPVIDDIPVLLVSPHQADHDEIDHVHRDDHRMQQARHFDRTGSERFETSRPHGTPRFYGYLLGEKFRRAVRPLKSDLPSSRVLVVCGGSGMDAEFLARHGARVISSDVSLGAARRTVARAREFGVAIEVIVADAECLPYHDRSFEVVYVHDGLHHLERPEVGIAEMARVSKRWVVVTEPTRARVTDVAIRFGLALEREEAGNLVRRLSPKEITEPLAQLGFIPILGQRYAMYYPHEPGQIMRALSRRWTFWLARYAWRLADALLGSLGNKVVVVASRPWVAGGSGEGEGEAT